MTHFTTAMRAILAALLLALAIPALAQTATKEAAPLEMDPGTAKRAVGLAHELRCLVCQNQTIAESNAELAVDLRRQINEQIAAGRTDREIIDYMVARYGDFVLYRPPFKAATAALWLGPFVLAAIALFVLSRVVRSRRALAEEPPLTEAERREAERLLDGRGTVDASAAPRDREARGAKGRRT
jgi:cytochrome c-type biogenesis protein CcmH